MGKPVTLDEEYIILKQKLELIAKQYGYNFGHPQVLALSQQLDQLILQMMKTNN